MRITVLSLKKRGDRIEAHVRADAIHAQVHISLWFEMPGVASRRALWAEAKDQALRYLDPA